MIDDVYKNVFWGHFPNLFAILRIPAFGADLGSPFQIGIVHWITALLSIIAFLKFRRNLNKIDKLFLISTVFFFIGLFFMSRASIVLWQNLPLLSTILFPWRFLNLLVFSSAVASAYLIFKLRNNKLVSLILIVAVIYVSRHWWGWVGQIPTSDKYYKDYQETTTDEGEFTPRGISPEIMNHASVNIEILSGATRISNEKLTNNHWQFDTLVLKNSTVKMAILDFPGWKVKINNRDGEIIKNFKNQNGDYSGLIVVNLPEGNYKVEVIFGETRLRILADYLTLASLILIMGLILKRYHAQNR
ncbi:hypothetical protein A2164_04465 [Candidatus Curtissbacteria bacterium RBG_13_35_7]|uniref:Membrane protein 6-pyruvoyl-tetrahydropterin synthase-related domain-containing protein n=1 Tax=Candidatus Curtissbacteria bacterium RBG_13_35_7 TaxID=1797705 RepID=A0A1F5G4X9_9BACT|nr:MAG: hypothetical protein A2164_04465 [Candidatus Curtissbacteria bacterium RBG_13_35_7]